jgi:hypothetical protein
VFKKLPVVVGEVWGLLTVLGESASDPLSFSLRCVCGTELTAKKGCVRSGNTTSCGCKRKATLSIKSKTHGLSTHPLYQVWADMRRRCTNPKTISFKNYGGRGITVCERWQKFEVFLSDMGERPYPDATIERLDVNAGYSPENCVWLPRSKQVENTRLTKLYTYDGVDYSIGDLKKIAATFGVSYNTLRGRLTNRWPVKKAVEQTTSRWWNPKAAPNYVKNGEGIKFLYT